MGAYEVSETGKDAAKGAPGGACHVQLRMAAWVSVQLG